MEDNQRIAYICICHKDPEFIARVSKKLNYKNDAIFIYVDGKVDITPFKEQCKNLPNVYFVEDRIKVFWGGWNYIIATMKTYELALSTGKFTRFVVLQGQDYPLFSNSYIHNFFEEHKETEFCRGIDITDSTDKGSYMKMCGFWYMDQKSPSEFLFKCLRRLTGKINGFGIPYRKRTYKNMRVIYGGAFTALTENCVKYVLNFYKNNPGYNRYMKHRFPPDELYVQSIVHSSPFKAKLYDKIIYNRQGFATKQNLTYFEYPKEVTVFKTIEEYEEIKKLGSLYLKKVNSTSKDLLDYIDSKTAD